MNVNGERGTAPTLEGGSDNAWIVAPLLLTIAVRQPSGEIRAHYWPRKSQFAYHDISDPNK
jgi:hypothetical protein